MKNTILIVLVALFSLSCMGSKNLYFHPSVDKVLFQMSNNYEIETILCLKYRKIWNGNIYVYDYYVPDIVKATKISVLMRSGCPAEFNGLWHNHPSVNFPDPKLHEYLKPYLELKHNWQLVYLSGADIRLTVWGGYDLAIVSTNNNFAWWERDQVTEYMGKRIRFPVDGQFVKNNK